MGIKNPQKKAKLAKKGRQTRWAPVFVVLKKFGIGGAKFHHVSQVTRHKRSWRRTKLHIKPRRQKKSHFG
ncbi:MAG TPA: hypothetical protein VJ208_03480 [Candidatus Nanoarchaeia archaeon]|nr:hypothetical protein [Candidatus Nanoarchaeia archaeon]